MPQTKGIDRANPFTDVTQLKKIRDAGFTFICRYLCTSVWKRLSSHEVKMINDAGLYLVTVYQDFNNAPERFSKYIGTTHARSAIIQAKSIGQPIGTPIYFSVDYDAVGTKTIDNVIAYFEGVASVMSEYKVGIYGSYDVINAVRAAVSEVTYFWQTPAWSRKKILKDFNLFQDTIDTPISGLESLGKVDTNTSHGNGGGWKLKK